MIADFDIELWGLVNINSNNNHEISCNIDFKFEFDGTLVDYVKMLSNYSKEIVEDDFGNLRYIGADPYNYVQFNNENWRIIGVMKDIENADGSKSDKVKLIRNDSIGSFAWDAANKYQSANNDWIYSNVKKVLNEGEYWNRTSGKCSDIANISSPCDFTSNGLTENAKNMISESVWYLGGSSAYDITPKIFYEKERGTTVSSGHKTKWTGNVGLMYPSDYGYATGGGETTNRSTCLNTNLSHWSESSISDCKNNNWLYTGTEQVTMTPDSNSYYNVYSLSSSGSFSILSANSIFAMFPVVYLNPDIGIERGGLGTSASPFVLEIE